MVFAGFTASLPELLHIGTGAKSPGRKSVRERAFGSLEYEHLYRVHEQTATVEGLHREAAATVPCRTRSGRTKSSASNGRPRFHATPRLHPILKNQTRDVVPEA